MLYVSSIIQDKKGRTHFIVSNNSKEDRFFIVKWEGKNWCFRIPAMPKPLDVYKLAEYSNLSYKDLPFDIDCSVPYTIEKAECFDGETKIVDFNFYCKLNS